MSKTSKIASAAAPAGIFLVAGEENFLSLMRVTGCASAT